MKASTRLFSIWSLYATTRVELFHGAVIPFSNAKNSRPVHAVSATCAMLFAPMPAAARESKMFLNGIGTANPPHRYTKTQCWEAFKNSEWFRRLDRHAHVVAETVLTKDNGIESRALAIDDLTAVFQINPDVLHERFLTHAPALATAAAHAALQDAGVL